MAKRFLVVVVVWVLAVSACTASVDDLADSDTQQIPAADERDFSVRSSLAMIPQSVTDEASGVLQVSVGDIIAAADQARLRLPLDPADPDDLLDFFAPLTGRSFDGRPLRVFVPLPELVRNNVALSEEIIDELGFSPGDISRFAAFESAPASFLLFDGVTGRSDLPEVAPGVGTIGEGDDLAVSLENRTVVRRLGRPLRTAQQGDHVALSLTTPPLADWVSGSFVSLAEDPILGALADRLDEQDVVSAFMLAEQETGPSGIGIGWRADDRGPQGVIVLAYGRESAAAEAFDAVAASFEGSVDAQPIADAIVLESIELLGADIVAVVSFANDRPPSVLFQLLLGQNGPFSVS